MGLRQEYEKGILEEKDLPKSPLELFKTWWQEAIAADDPMRDAVYLSTIDSDNHPDARIVLLKSFDETGFYFFTNYQSAKGIELLENPSSCLVLYWPTLQRQVRIKGESLKTSRDTSHEYFSHRPRGSQLSSWASEQSQEISGRNYLETRVKDFEQQFLNQEVPCPPHWGGYCLKPHYFEFWQGRVDRLHDRFCFKKAEDGFFSVHRLAP